uniref:Protein Wnt n=1 Tax=Lygus hesperus TaxID=30085 RepID=A0A0K8TFX1_LYGHE
MITFLIVSIITAVHASSPSWLSIGSGEFNGCKSAKGFSVGQVRLCQVYNDHMEGVSAGAGAGLLECKHQFNNRRWNCSTVEDSSVFGPLNTIGSRESAFIHAIMAAGITHAIGRRCRDGQLSSCSCSRAGRPKDLHHQWIWGGCGDNLEYGYKFTQSFVDVRERERRYRRGSAEHGRALMNLHNNEAGRRAVIKMSKVTCKCHGVSGSCSLITCWQQLSTFREIGDYIMDKYDGATEVKVNTRGKLQIKDPRFGLPTPNDLIYIDESPNYCVPNPSLGSLGTQGRICNRTSQGMDGCNLMCCGRGYNTRKVSIGERCDCSFHWCCYVKCNQCYKTVDIHSCK